MADLKERNRKRRKVSVKTPGGDTRRRYLARKPSKAVCAETGQELHGMQRKGAMDAKNSAKTTLRPERPYGGILSSSAMRSKIKAKARAQDTGQISSSDIIQVGRICVKTAGRDAGLKCAIVEVHDDGQVTIDGQTRRRKVSTDHLEPLSQTADLKKGASHSNVKKALENLNVEVKDTKPKKKKAKPKKSKKSTKKKSDKKDDEDSTGSKASSNKKSKKKDIPSESQIRSMTKDEMEKTAKEEYGIELSTNNLKDEMVENFLKGLKE